MQVPDQAYLTTDQRGQNVAEFQRYQRSEMVTPAGVSNAKAQSFKSLASRLQSFANQQGQLADQSAAREG